MSNCLNHPHVHPMPQKRKTHDPEKSSIQKSRNNEAKTLEKKQAGDETNIDRLSDLPEPIIHKILLCLPLSDAINTKRLSRHWLHSIWPSCPILYFDEDSFEANYFLYSHKDNGNRRRFSKFLLKSLEKQKEGTCSRNYSSMEKFGIQMALLNQKYDHILDGWLKFAVQNDVQELNLRIKRVKDHCFKTYWLDGCVFACPSLTSLYLDYCGIQLKDCVINLPSLKRLTLSEVKIKQDSFSRLIRGCPSVEHLCVEFCKGLKIIDVTAPNLKSLKLNFTEIYWVSLGSPRLESVEFSGNFASFGSGEFGILGTVKDMKLKNLDVTDRLRNLLDESRMLETLIMDGCMELERITVHRKIERFSMVRCRGIVEAVVLSPILKSLEYSGDEKISFCCREDSLGSAEVRISLDPMQLSEDWFFGLKKLLQVFVKSKLLTLACPSDQKTSQLASLIMSTQL